MTKTANHTPIPWQVKHAVITADRAMVARCTVPNPMNTLANVEYANAAFIVRAVNSHAALVEALGKLLWLNSSQGVTEEEYEVAEQAAHAALSLTKGA